MDCEHGHVEFVTKSLLGLSAQRAWLNLDHGTRTRPAVVLGRGTGARASACCRSAARVRSVVTAQSRARAPRLPLRETAVDSYNRKYKSV